MLRSGMRSKLLLLLPLLVNGAATLKLASVLASHMVAQHSAPVPIWGHAPAGQRVEVTLVTTLGSRTVSQLATAAGTFTVALPPQPAGLEPGEITVRAGADRLKLEDVVFGTVVLCSGQSNMGLGVEATENPRQVLAEAGHHGSGLRLMNVANTQAGCNATSPLADAPVDRPWSTPGAVSPANFSAACYFLGVELTKRRPQHPVGLITAAWGGVGIEVFMTHRALHRCGNCGHNRGGCGRTHQPPPSAVDYSNPDPGLEYIQQRRSTAAAPTCGIPRVPGTLWNSMIAPLLPLRLGLFLWYQGESNADQPTLYRHCLRELIVQWRSEFSAEWSKLPGQLEPADAVNFTPFTVVQLAPWPNQDSGLLPKMRFAQQEAVRMLPQTGMVVAADLGDPAGVFHPIHTPYKSELGRRAALVADRLVFGNKSVELHGPQVVNVTWDVYEPSWGAAWHHGTPYDPTFQDVSTACGFAADPGGSGPWLCGGLRVMFDRDVVLRSSYGGVYGLQHAFELLNEVYAEDENAADRRRVNETACPSMLWPNCSRCPCKQPLALLSGSQHLQPFRTLQFNTTFVSGVPAVLRYGFGDYPSLLLYDAMDGRPVAPFNVSIE